MTSLALTSGLHFTAAMRINAGKDKLVDDSSVAWEKKYCAAHHELRKNAACVEQVASREQTCTKWYSDMQDAGSDFKRNILFFSPPEGCRTFFAEKEDIMYQLDNPPPQTIKNAVKACEPEALRVCIQSTCPTFCALTDADCAGDACKSICETQGHAMWKTGAIECEKDQAWGKCMADHVEKLKKAGRFHALEAISREHLLKCVCVSRLKDDGNGICHQGSQGIQFPQKWCEFNKSPSWQQLLNSRNSSMTDEWTTAPTCEQRYDVD